MVTAQKFAEKLSETPLSVTAISARNLEALGATHQFYVKNAFDERGELSATTAFSGLGGPVWVSLVQPRTIGVNLISQF